MGSVKAEKRQKRIGQIARQGFGKTPDYVASLKNATLEKMTKLIKLVGMLLQTKFTCFGAAIERELNCQTQDLQPSPAIIVYSFEVFPCQPAQSA